ncbi:peptide chain release factor N(5)-glutamine methyltransferase [Psychrobacter sp. ANT_H3]|uniref:peptide chain release factor N(5)-glutamine methyltransferase n=1 Tax=Psychrobacter sp. ANT_H3 TaxID=3019444 RepID=UPI0022F15C0F|nr:peptide chain release factor N(5)-glutamine methyltransferase [Psychrobacter sp. ANT_H3]MDA5132197.1 peptide chain release factor N(5)-glutamine methyltransferase [Psychrobacter sp. ANT_H3]
MTAPTIGQIKQQVQQWLNESENSNIPSFWFTDWLLFVIDKPSSFLITDENYQLTDSELEQFHAGVTKMQQGTPLAYLTGQQEFWSLNFKVNEHTLIPRPDTEILIEQVLTCINSQPKSVDNNKKPKRLLDLGTGSGCIAISLAHELKQSCQNSSTESWQVVAVDLSSEALKVAKHNAMVNEVADIEFIQSSWYDALSTQDESLFDVIVSNPPYIDEEDEHLARLVAEPISALSAPNHGLADIEHIVQQAPQHLNVGGLLAIEHGFDQGSAVRQLFLDNRFDSVHTVQDFGGNDRVTLGQLS